MTKITANNPDRKSWIQIGKDSDFPIQNIPFGIYSDKGTSPRTCVAIGNKIADLYELANRGYLDDLGITADDFKKPELNDLMKSGKMGMRKLRNRLADLFDTNTPDLQSKESDISAILKPQRSVTMHLPVRVGDYTDFYSSIEHATNIGTMFRDPKNALLPNWRHIPVAYHGRSSSIVPSGVAIHRPKGQTRPNPEEPPVFGPTKRLDFELELAFVTFDGKPMGDSISTEEADDYIFGMVLFNDWSARDIQKWEYVPLGPFLAKNFASSVSPWIVTLDALEPYRTLGPAQNPEVLPYLEFEGEKNIDINLEVAIDTGSGEETAICFSNYKYLYWTLNQQLAHHTVNGCNIRGGDMMASGTISGSKPTSFGSMLELSWSGSKPIKLADGTQRTFVNDGDTVIMRGHAMGNGVKIGFGEVRTKVLPAK
ncbi:fumarylacetoacetase [Cryomorpha ignava]|uniref:fumarylacetoacetase n=1 Tax=Cryomorpha ignava TaxID=101383 RepID=A0A7K3WTI8_9FLAO|nr:fumarylacetoacetase [Cryomorpha ignava]NEN24341.1 fumarylacetoacetase [Cryomorpha ignava]